MAPGRQVPRAAHRLHQQDGPRRRRLRRGGRRRSATRLGARPVPIQLPIGAEDKFAGVVDLVRAARALFLGRRDRGAARGRRAGGDGRRGGGGAREADRGGGRRRRRDRRRRSSRASRIDEAQLKAALRKATIDCKIVPVLAGAALRNKGVQPLLDAVVRLPAVAAGGAAGDGRRAGHRGADDAAARRHGAVLRAGLQGRDGRGAQGGLPAHLLGRAAARATRSTTRARAATRRWRGCSRCTPNRREQIERAGAGSIVVAMGLKDAGTGDTLCVAEGADHPRAHRHLRAGDLARHRAEDAGREGEAGLRR